MDDKNQVKEVMVSVICLTYNHESYIRQCLDGFVMQKTDFAFEAIVHDDASTDHTAEIIREYEEKYPNIIKPIYQDENQFSKNSPFLETYVLPKLKGKYIALCEGDDYWTDPLKLQRQVDFLEEHEDFSMCFHAASIINETSSSKIIKCESIEEREYFAQDIFPCWIVPTASVVFRNASAALFPPLKHKEWQLFGDIVLFLQCARVGRMWGMNDKMSVYRMTESGLVRTCQRDSSIVEKRCRHYQFLLINFSNIDKRWCHNYIAKYYYNQFQTTALFKGKINNLMMSMSHSPRYAVQRIIDAFRRRVDKMF